MEQSLDVIEAEVHSSLLAFLREQGKSRWPHHLTMARLVARALRLGRSALIQTSTSVDQYSLSYLTPALLGDWSVLLVTPLSVQKRLLQVEIPQLQQWLKIEKEIQTGDRWQLENSPGLMLTSSDSWLEDRLQNQGRFPRDIPILIDQADDWEEKTRSQLTASIQYQHWDELINKYPPQAEAIRNIRVKLTKAIFSRPKNPYECYLIEALEYKILQSLLPILATEELLSPIWIKFWQLLQIDNQLIWASIKRKTGQFTLHIAPIEVATALSQIWQQQSVVVIGSFLDWESSAPIYRQQLGLGELTCLKFSPNRQNEHIQLYLPDRLPMPNTPEFQGVLIEQVRTLVSFSKDIKQPVVLLVGDIPLKAQIGSIMAAEFGSRVQVENTNLADNGILISGWEFWRKYQDKFPTPQLLIIATLPLPSLENPLVAGRVAYHKRQRQDWFHLYLLPTALREIQRAVLSLRQSQGVVALFDNRVNHRSYGSKILTALEPCARINYIDPSWFGLRY